MATQTGGDDFDRTELLATRGPVRTGSSDEQLEPGARLGRYRIESLLGRGGMGEVYRAEQLEPVRRTVALKLLRLQRLNARHLAYFEVERQLLAQMRHPAIAQIYDADTTADGHPFFAMEFIEGSPLTRFCDSHELTLRKRIELLIRICEGVQHAHQKGVIHRDLKPGNLLVDDVDGRPLPKIIDFGIATAGESDAVGGGSREVAGTPEYMSPEQAGDDQSLVDTRSDVYSLGVVLYELLTGQRPSAAGETVTGPDRTLRLPSECLSTLPPGDAGSVATRQGLRLPDMRRILRTELDWIVAKAMRHERSERYQSAAALADDLQRFLDGGVVQAVPHSRRYAWSKFAGRHRGSLMAATAVLVALVAGLAVSIYGLMEARTQRAIAVERSAQLEKVAEFQQSMLKDIDIEAMGIGMRDGLRSQVKANVPDQLPSFDAALGHASSADVARTLIDRNILVNAELAIDSDFTGNPALAADLRESVASVRSVLGLHDAAVTGYRQVAHYREQALGAGDPSTLSARQELAGALLSAAQPEEALDIVKDGLAHADALPADDPLRFRLRINEAEATAALGDRKEARGMYEAMYREGVATRGERDPTVMEIMNNYAILLARMGEPKLARPRMERLVDLRKQVLGPEHEDTLSSLHNLAPIRMMTGDKEAAIALQRDLVVTQTRRLGAEHPTTLAERANLATMLIDSGQLDEALPLTQSVLDARARVLGNEHPDTLRTRLNLSTLYARMDDFKHALLLQSEVLASRTRLLGARHPDTLYIAVNHAGTLRQDGQVKASLAEAGRIIPVAREVLGDQHPQTQTIMKIQAEDASDLGDRALAISSYQALLAMRDKALGGQDKATIDAAWTLEGELIDAGRMKEAAQVRARYVTPLLAAPADSLAPDMRDYADHIRKTELEESGQAALESRQAGLSAR